MIPSDIMQEYNNVSKTFPSAWIGYNAAARKYSVNIFPKFLTNSIFIVHLHPVLTTPVNMCDKH